jgi:hypothetical protein
VPANRPPVARESAGRGGSRRGGQRFRLRDRGRRWPRPAETRCPQNAAARRLEPRNEYRARRVHRRPREHRMPDLHRVHRRRELQRLRGIRAARRTVERPSVVDARDRSSTWWNARRDKGGDQSLAETWNGSSWSIDPTPDAPGHAFHNLTAVACTAADFCTAVGAVGNADYGSWFTLAEERGRLGARGDTEPDKRAAERDDHAGTTRDPRTSAREQPRGRCLRDKRRLHRGRHDHRRRSRRWNARRELPGLSGSPPTSDYCTVSCVI